MTSIDRQDLRKAVQKYLLTCASDPVLVQFFEKNHDRMRDYIVKHNLVEKREYENLSEKEMMKLNIDRYVHTFKLAKEMNQFNMVYRKADYIMTVVGATLNTSAFLNTIELLGDQKQAAKWRDLVLNAKAFGGYGQTQLGHGSNVQGLETEAHYDQKKQVFRINSPTITSAKYWPGVLGLFSTHSVIQAKTYVKGKFIGIQTFVVEIRDEKLNNLSGIQAGDIGPKFGFHRVDNGYLKINNQQIPRDSMLMRYIQVTPQGEVLGLENKAAVKYAYGSMLYLRVALPFHFAITHITTPARHLYALYEKMGIEKQPQYKKQIIEYLATGNGIVIANCYPKKIFQSYTKQLNNKNFQKADKLLTSCHIISATFKALSSWKAVKISSQIATRNIYSVFRTTTLPYSFNNILPAATYEGDNSVLLQQTARFILMKDKGEDLVKPALKVRDDDLGAVIGMLKYVVSMEVRRLKKIFEKEFQAGVGMKTFWNEKHQRDIIDVSKLWGVLQLLSGYADTLNGMTQLKPFFTKLGKVFIKNLLVDTPQVYSYGFEIQQIESWKEITDDELWALTNLTGSINIPFEEHKLVERSGNWIRSKL